MCSAACRVCLLGSAVMYSRVTFDSSREEWRSTFLTNTQDAGFIAVDEEVKDSTDTTGFNRIRNRSGRGRNKR